MNVFTVSEDGTVVDCDAIQKQYVDPKDDPNYGVPLNVGTLCLFHWQGKWCAVRGDFQGFKSEFCSAGFGRTIGAAIDDLDGT